LGNYGFGPSFSSGGGIVIIKSEGVVLGIKKIFNIVEPNGEQPIFLSCSQTTRPEEKEGKGAHLICFFQK
jgi:hypothetical protein